MQFCILFRSLCMCVCAYACDFVVGIESYMSQCNRCEFPLVSLTMFVVSGVFCVVVVVVIALLLYVFSQHFSSSLHFSFYSFGLICCSLASFVTIIIVSCFLCESGCKQSFAYFVLSEMKGPPASTCMCILLVIYTHCKHPVI